MFLILLAFCLPWPSVRWGEKGGGGWGGTATALPSRAHTHTYSLHHTLFITNIPQQQPPFFFSATPTSPPLHQLSLALHFPAERINLWTGSQPGTHTTILYKRLPMRSPHLVPIITRHWALCGSAGLPCFTGSALTVHFCVGLLPTESHSSLSILFWVLRF